MITWDWSYYWPNFTERFVLRATLLDECQIYRRGRGTVWEEAIFSRFPPPPAINDDVRPLGKYETKMAARNEKRSILTDFTKKKGTMNNTGENTHKSLNYQFNALSNILSVARENTQHTQRSPLHEKLDLHQIYSVQIWCRKVQTKVK